MILHSCSARRFLKRATLSPAALPAWLISGAPKTTAMPIMAMGTAASMSFSITTRGSPPLGFGRFFSCCSR